MNIIDKIEQKFMKAEKPDFNVGDTVKVSLRIIEGEKDRIQVFSGIVIAKNGKGLNESFTVRKITYGEGVERIFPVHSPRVEKIEVEKQGVVRRAKLYYLRSRLGKKAIRIKEKRS
jgi:large subunit ribosomal protein L19